MPSDLHGFVQERLVRDWFRSRKTTGSRDNDFWMRVVDSLRELIAGKAAENHGIFEKAQREEKKSRNEEEKERMYV